MEVEASSAARTQLAQLRQPLHKLTAEDESDVAIGELAAPAAHHRPASTRPTAFVGGVVLLR